MATRDILEHASSTELVEAVEDNLVAFGRVIGRWESMESHEGPDMHWYLSDVPFPLFNAAVGLRLEAPGADAAIAALVGRARERGVPLMVWTGPATRPRDMGARPIRAGFAEGQPSPGMVLDLDELGPGPDGSVRSFLGRLDGTPVATASVLLGAGVAGVYNVATLPRARRRGVGRAITYRALAEARAAGYHYAILHASPAGAPLYRAMGFREVCTVFTYVWAPDGTA